MQVVYVGEEMPEKFSKSLFLAGPSSRNKEEQNSWRPDALQILNDIGFNGVVFIPEDRDGTFKQSYDDQVEWEEKYLNVADCIVFWVPRDLSSDSQGKLKMPAFTTNVEFGAWCNTGKIVFGAPEEAEKNTYLRYYADKYHVPVSNTLTNTLQNALTMLGEGVEREGGEREVPLLIWNTKSFQSWYQAQKDAGNRLDGAKVLYSFRPGDTQSPFLWILQVDIFISSEQRHKTNEFVLARTDISSVLMWKKNAPIEQSEVVLIKEFRSPAATQDGFIRELVGGSSPDGKDVLDTAVSEIFEETGMYFSPERLKIETSRQLAGTLSAHKSHLYSIELSAEEMQWFKSQSGISHGKEEDSEKTFIEVNTVENVISNPNIDWTTVGQILSVVFKV